MTTLQERATLQSVMWIAVAVYECICNKQNYIITELGKHFLNLDKMSDKWFAEQDR